MLELQVKENVAQKRVIGCKSQEVKANSKILCLARADFKELFKHIHYGFSSLT